MLDIKSLSELLLQNPIEILPLNNDSSVKVYEILIAYYKIMELETSSINIFLNHTSISLKNIFLSNVYRNILDSK
jgi:hypothetical protein